MDSSIGHQIYGGAATYGKIRTGLNTAFVTVLGVIMIIIGIIISRKQPKLTNTTTGIIISDPICNSYSDKDMVKWRCDIQVSYKVGGVEYRTNLFTNDLVKYSKGQSVTVYYNPEFPGNGNLFSDNIKPIGYVILVLGILILIGSWVWLFIVFKFKVAAAATGATSFAGDLTSVFKR